MGWDRPLAGLGRLLGHHAAPDGVQLVRRDPETFGSPQLRLTDFVRTRHKWAAVYDPDQELSLGLGRGLVLSQAKVNRHLP